MTNINNLKNLSTELWAAHKAIESEIREANLKEALDFAITDFSWRLSMESTAIFATPLSERAIEWQADCPSDQLEGFFKFLNPYPNLRVTFINQRDNVVIALEDVWPAQMRSLDSTAITDFLDFIRDIKEAGVLANDYEEDIQTIVKGNNDHIEELKKYNNLCEKVLILDCWYLPGWRRLEKDLDRHLPIRLRFGGEMPVGHLSGVIVSADGSVGQLDLGPIAPDPAAIRGRFQEVHRWYCGSTLVGVYQRQEEHEDGFSNLVWDARTANVKAEGSRYRSKD